MTFDEFVGAELGALARFSGALAWDRHLAKDMLSDALLKVARRWRRISTMDDPAAYVRQVVVNTYLSDRRKASRRRTVPTSDMWLLDSRRAGCRGGCRGAARGRCAAAAAEGGRRAPLSV